MNGQRMSPAQLREFRPPFPVDPRHRMSELPAKVLNDRMLFFGHLLFFGALYVINNPFFTLTAETKYGVFFGMLILGTVISVSRGTKSLTTAIPLIVAFALFYSIAILQINTVSGEKANSQMLQYMQAALSLSCCIFSLLFARGLNTKMMAKALVLFALPCCLWIAMNFSELQAWEQQDSFVLGNLSYTTYQITTLMFAIGALAALSLASLDRMWSVSNAFYIAIFVVFSYYVFNGLGRGEAVAYALAVLLYLAPRITILAAPFSYSLFQIVVIFFDTPLTQRLRGILDGDYGERDHLFELSVQLLQQSPSTVLLGGGLNHFQSYWSLPLGLYPHNMFIESLISGGIGLFISMLAIFVWPLIRSFRVLFQKDMEKRFLFSLLALVIVVASKSGTILILWVVSTYACVGIELLDRRSNRQQFQPAFRPSRNHEFRL